MMKNMAEKNRKNFFSRKLAKFHTCDDCLRGGKGGGSRGGVDGRTNFKRRINP